MPGNKHTAEDDGRQQKDGKQAAQQPQLLPDGGKDEVRMPGRQAPGALGLGLGTMEQPLPRELAAAQGQKAPGLLPADAQRIQIVVKEGHEPLFHMQAKMKISTRALPMSPDTAA